LLFRKCYGTVRFNKKSYVLVGNSGVKLYGAGLLRLNLGRGGRTIPLINGNMVRLTDMPWHVPTHLFMYAVGPRHGVAVTKLRHLELLEYRRVDIVFFDSQTHHSLG
jgi:hypothetical protein